MAGAVHFDTLQKTYIAFYQRPADPAGLKYWAGRMAEAEGDSTAVVDAFAASVESRALYGTITQDTLGGVIDQVYQALFQREPDVHGKAFYTAAFAQGTLTMGNIVLAILQGAQKDDLAAIHNKLAVAREFTRQVDGRAFQDADFGNGWGAAYAYTGQANAAMARTMLAGVTADPATILDAAAITRILQGQNAVKEAVGGRVPGSGTLCESGPVDGTPVDSAPDESTPDDGTPDHSTPIDGKPDDNMPGDSTPNESEPGNTVPDSDAPEDSTPDNSTPGDSGPIDSQPGGSATISFVTGDEDDTILVTADGTAGNGASIWVEAGGGNDVITVESTGHVRMALNAGAGDDRVLLTSGISSVTARDGIDGGEGFDTLVVQGGSMVQADYAALARSVSGFEAIEFASPADVDAGQLTQFEWLRFAAGASEVDVARARVALDTAQWALFEAQMLYPEGVEQASLAVEHAEKAWEAAKAAVLDDASQVTGVTAGQVLVAGGSLSATAGGYQSATQTEDADAGSLNVVSRGAGALIKAYAEDLNLTIVASPDGAVATQLKGDVRTADISFVHTNNEPGNSAAGSGDAASIFVAASMNELAALSSVSIQGLGLAMISNYSGSLLTAVDASGMVSASAVDRGHTGETAGLIYQSSNSMAEVITLGAGVDHIMLRESTVASMDVVEGLHLLAFDDRPGELDRQNSDSLVLEVEIEAEVDVEAGEGTGFRAVNVGSISLGDVPETLDDALALLAGEGGQAVFHWGGDTYAFADDGNAKVDGSDVLVRLVGELDLDLLALSLNADVNS